MRAIVITALILGMLPFIFGRPWLGVLLWVWVSVMNPHKLAYGFANDFPFVAIIACVTLLSALFSKELKRPPMNALTVALLLFIVWMAVTQIFALYPAESLVKWTLMMKTQLLAILIPMLFHSKERLRQLIWVIVLSLAYYGTKGGVWILLTGGGGTVTGPGGYIQDNNALAVAIVMIIPLMRYLQLTSPSRSVRWVLIVMMVLCSVAVLGSYSRGALLAVSAMLAFLWLKGRHKLPFLLVALLAIPLVLAYMPDKWFNRMDTLATYEQDRSATGRFNAWRTMFNLANDRPLVGGGFEVAEPGVYERYSPDPTRKVLVAHSIYFQALGEHGYVGLGLYLLLFFVLWRKASWIIRATKGRADLAWARDLVTMMQVSFIGFAVGGAFLSLVYFDVPYYLIGVMIATLALVEGELRATLSAPTTASPAGLIEDVPRSRTSSQGAE